MNNNPIYRFKLAYPDCGVYYTHNSSGKVEDWFEAGSLQDFINFSYGPFRVEDLQVDYGELNRVYKGDVNVFLRSMRSHSDSYGQFFLALNHDKTMKLFVREKYIFSFMMYFEGWDFFHLMWQANDDEYYAYRSLADTLMRVTYQDNWGFSRVLELVMLARFEDLKFTGKSIIAEKFGFYSSYGLIEKLYEELSLSNLKDFNHCLMKYFIMNQLKSSTQINIPLDHEYILKSFNNTVINPHQNVELILRLSRFFEGVEFFDNLLFDPKRSEDVLDKFRFPQRFVDPKIITL
jgi:hypothetical protein